MESLNAELIGTGGNGFCESDHYFHYQLGIVDVEIISGFRVKTFNAEYVYSYNSKEIDFCTIYEEEKITIPMIPVEAQYLLYRMMCWFEPNRRIKADFISLYLQNYGLEHLVVFEKALAQKLPYWAIDEVKDFMKGGQ